jgi:hypothetical protein
LLYETITKNNIHGPCGKLKPDAMCMKDGVCSKNFPKQFTDYTYEAENGYPLYERKNDGNYIFIGKNKIDNSWVVPYNSFLSTKYDCHINVEICTTVKAVKYIYKVCILIYYQ